MGVNNLGGGGVEVKNRGGPSADDVLNSCSIGQESAQLPFLLGKGKGHGAWHFRTK